MVEILEKSNAPPDVSKKCVFLVNVFVPIFLKSSNNDVICIIAFQVLSKYLALVEDPETRLSLATKLKCHKVSVEVSRVVATCMYVCFFSIWLLLNAFLLSSTTSFWLIFVLNSS